MVLPTRLHVLQRASQPLDIVTARLRGWGGEVHGGDSAEAALTALTAGSADMVMIDAWADDAMNLLAWLKADGGLRHVPAIVATADESAMIASHALALGADDLFVLPIEDAELYARTRALSRLAVMEVERRRRAAVQAEFHVEVPTEMPTVPAIDRIAILMIGPAGTDQVQVMTALDGAATAAYAETTTGALERLRRGDIDVALITVTHGHDDLHELCAQVRSDPELFDLPVLLVARPDHLADRAQPFEWGVSDVLLQPFQPEVLRLRVQGWVRQQRLRRRLRGSFEGSELPPTIDRLTRLYGHGFLHAYVDRLIRMNRALDRPLAVTGLAVEDLTRINRTLGYAAGDRALAAIGTMIARVWRAEDLPARHGDGRFCVVLDGAGADDAAAAARRIAEILTRTPITVGDDGRSLRPGLRTGVAELAEGDDAATLIGRAFDQMEPSDLRRAS